MRSLGLKTLQIKDDIPLYVTLDSLTTWDKNENIVLKNFQTMERWKIMFIQSKLRILQLGQWSMR